ncbi:uncharacterized protein [Physcomitrium patens]|uniref:uncharacterized protein isoform X2 n=1 Tax=Physcomitrium patens TaxID=3218 RepID=UPI003CCD0170
MEAKRTGKLKENPDNPCGPSRPADYAHSLTPHNDPVFEGGCLGAIRSPSRRMLAAFLKGEKLQLPYVNGCVRGSGIARSWWM